MKRIISCVLCLLFIFNLTSCDEASENSITEKTVAVKYASANEFAADEYISQGFTRVTYNSSADVVLAVENRKTDYGILDEFELNSFISAGRKIKKSGICEYSVSYCVYFSSGNEALRDSFNRAINELAQDGTLKRIETAHLNGEKFKHEKANNENGTLTMLCDPSFENRVYTDDNGSIVGLDVDIARAICNNSGYNLEFVTADFDELFTKLQDGEGDFIISACEVNEEREEYYLSSDVYFTLNYNLIERK